MQVRAVVVSPDLQDFVRAYGALYPQNVAELRTGEKSSVYMHRLTQKPGEYIIPGSDTISISLALHGGFSAGLDLGHGYFRQAVPAYAFGVIGPQSGTTRFEIPCRLEALNFSIPVARARVVTGGEPADIGALAGNLVEDAMCVHLLQSLWLELSERGPRGSLFVDRAIDVLVLRLLRLSGASDREFVCDKPYVSDWRVRRSMEMLAGRLGDDIRLAEVASEVGLSPTHYAALFRAATGLPLHRWLMKRRVARACDLLCDPRRSITDIAFSCGFASSQHLATAFKKQIGTTPSEYRRDRLL